MKYGTFCRLAVVAIVVFLAANYLVWKLYTETLLTKKFDGGDMARTSYVLDSKLERKNAIDLPRRHAMFDPDRTRHADVLTLGDSFAMGFGEGHNHFFQDYLATYSEKEVVNFWPYPAADDVMGFSPLTDLVILYNSGMLDRLKPKYVLLESVERYCVQRYSHPYDFSQTVPRDQLLKFYRGQKYDFNYLPPVGFVNTGNVKFFYYKLLYRLNDHAYSKGSYAPVYRRLTKPWFSRNGDHILFVNEDLRGLPLATDDNMAKLNANLNKMAELLARKGITLVFMPIVDKYDLYSDYIADNPYPKSTFFEKLRPLPKKYRFVDTKALLKEELDKGVLDVFYPDETHWSWKAAEKVFRATRLP